MSNSSIVNEGKDKILNPDKKVTEIDGIKFKILPFSDVVFQELGIVISQVVSVMDIVSKVFNDGLEGASLAQLGAQVPGLMSVLIPASSNIIALSLKPLEDKELKIDKQWVEENVYAKDRIRLLGECIEANGVREMLGELAGAAKKLIPATPQTPALPVSTPMPSSVATTPATSPTP